jgi:outer membrane protein TolC
MTRSSWSARIIHSATVPPYVRARRALLASVLIAAMAGGCASFSPDGGMSAVSSIAAPELRSDVVKASTDDAAAAARGRVSRLLASPLSPDAAVQIALANNKGLQSAFNELGMAEAAKVEGSLPPNPTFSLSGISTPVELDIERRIVADILALATLPTREEIAAENFRQAQLRAAETTLRVGFETRRRYYRAVAALEIEISLSQAVSAAEAAANLAKRLGETGAMNKLDRTREEAFWAELVTQLAAARARAASERERLIRALGLWDNNDALKLPRALPAIPKAPRTLVAAQTDAIRRRVDLRIARLEMEALAKSYGLTQATRFINLLEASGVSRTQAEGGVRGTGGGVEVDFQIPIFDFGEARLRQAGESYMRAVNRLTAMSVNARSQARDAYQRYRSGYDIANRYQRDVLPLRKIIADETTLRYGAMQTDVFSLLSEARQRVAVQITATEAQRDFWLASTDLDAAIAGGGVDAAGSAGEPAINAGWATTSE